MILSVNHRSSRTINIHYWRPQKTGLQNSRLSDQVKYYRSTRTSKYNLTAAGKLVITMTTSSNLVELKIELVILPISELDYSNHRAILSPQYDWFHHRAFTISHRAICHHIAQIVSNDTFTSIDNIFTTNGSIYSSYYSRKSPI